MSRDTVRIPGYTEPVWLANVRARADQMHLDMAGRRTLTLGQLTGRLAAAPPGVPVAFRGCGLDDCEPDRFISWRGVYADLALEPTRTGGTPVLVVDLLTRCRDANGATFEGYKGGDYTMGADTPVWIDYYGEWHDWGVVDVRPLMRGHEIVKVLLVVRDWDGES